MHDDEPTTTARVVLYSRAGCHLCADARAIVAAEAALAGTTWREVDVDRDDEPGRDLSQYGDLVPVVEVDGVRQGYWRIESARLRRALAAR
ncbi:glutaredoxin family protein [Cellulomonas palmilytica]|uniref:glutaredoxin family protein n=1 Tax=Cellulomonas palmilytica TaxID=2608402 RepID=UPI001F48AC24|nr:glutaredoxin family protein [Cellulomonas palmilytica]